MVYDKKHSCDDCDKCLKRVGIFNLIRVPFLYLDLGDKVHEDLGHGYHQYYVCEDCFKDGI